MQLLNYFSVEVQCLVITDFYLPTAQAKKEANKSYPHSLMCISALLLTDWTIFGEWFDKPQ